MYVCIILYIHRYPAQQSVHSLADGIQFSYNFSCTNTNGVQLSLTNTN